MARFVLVHGAFAGGWIWRPLVDLLEAAGHSVTAPDLSGATLDAYVRDLREVLERMATQPSWWPAAWAAWWQPRSPRTHPTGSRA
jgi:hypothetical protein